MAGVRGQPYLSRSGFRQRHLERALSGTNKVPRQQTVLNFKLVLAKIKLCSERRRSRFKIRVVGATGSELCELGISL